MFSRDQAQKLFEKILSYSAFPECSVALVSSEELNVRFANNGITTSGFTVKRSVAVTSSRDRRSGSTSTDSIDDAALRAAVRRSEELAEITPPNPEHMPPLGPQQYPAVDNWAEETARARSPEIIPQIRTITAAAAKEKLVAAGFLRRAARVSAIANKNGLFGYHRSTGAHLSTTFRTPDGASVGWASQPTVRVSELDGARLAETAIGKCLRWRKPVRLEPGKYTVLLEPAACADLLGWFAWEFSARAAEEGRSFLSRPGGGTLLGEKLFPEIITLHSDPFDSRLPSAPWSWDSRPARKMTWVEKGVVRNLYYDRYWAQKAGREPTPFPSSDLLDGADASLAELMRSIEHGLLVTHFWYIVTVNPKTLQATGLTRDGLFLIEKGQVSAPVMNFRFNESPVRLLQNARAVGPPARVGGLDDGLMIAPPLVSAEFTFSSVSDAV